MNETEIDRLLEKGRNTEIDWFKDNTPTEKIALALSAMANTRGGTLMLGVGPTGTVQGVRNPSEAIDRLLEAALSLEPGLIIPLPRAKVVQDKNLIVAQVPNGMPNVYALNGHYLRRDGAQNIGLKPSELRRLIIQRGVTSFEAEAVPGTTLDDIDWDKAQAYITSLSGISDPDPQRMLERRGCLTRRDGELCPTHAGILLFGNDPRRHIRGSDITAARFAGETMGDIFSRQDISGTLPDQIRRAETFLADHLRKGVQIGSKMERSEQFEYPMEAARELLVNAVAHRDYSITGDGIRLFIFRDRMEVTSPGLLAGPVTIDNIKDERFSRNPIIVQVLADMGFIERLGYGVDRVIDLMHAQNLREPSFTETAGGFQVVLYSEPERQITRPRKHAEFDLDTLIGDTLLNPRQERALHYLTVENHTRITNSDLQNLCPDVHQETIRRDLVDLVNKNIFLKKGQKRGSYYVLNTGDDSES